LETALKSSISSFRSIPQLKVRPSQEIIALQNARSSSASCERPSEDFGTRNRKHPKSPLHSHQIDEQLDVTSSFALSLVRFDESGLSLKVSFFGPNVFVWFLSPATVCHRWKGIWQWLRNGG
jgi:hypothetical protein